MPFWRPIAGGSIGGSLGVEGGGGGCRDVYRADGSSTDLELHHLFLGMDWTRRRIAAGVRNTIPLWCTATTCWPGISRLAREPARPSGVLRPKAVVQAVHTHSLRFPTRRSSAQWLGMGRLRRDSFEAERWPTRPGGALACPACTVLGTVQAMAGEPEKECHDKLGKTSWRFSCNTDRADCTNSELSCILQANAVLLKNLFCFAVLSCAV